MRVTTVTPYAGVWIEIARVNAAAQCVTVTPYAGVWIEIAGFNNGSIATLSLPTRECGLKSPY